MVRSDANAHQSTGSGRGSLPTPSGLRITDPDAIAACEFVDAHYRALGHMAPAQFSREEQHALSVLTAYIKSQRKGEEVAWLREVDAGTDSACLVVCIAGDPGSFPVYA